MQAAADSPAITAARAEHLSELGWRQVDLFASSGLNSQQLDKFVNSTIRLCASEAGDFVRQINISAGVDNDDGWHRWCVHYLSGPPGVLTD